MDYILLCQTIDYKLLHTYIHYNQWSYIEEDVNENTIIFNLNAIRVYTCTIYVRITENSPKTYLNLFHVN